MINEAMNVVDDAPFRRGRRGGAAQGAARRAIASAWSSVTATRKSVVRLASRLHAHLRPATPLIDRRVHFAYERVPKLDVEELVLEEVPDIDYSVIGGLTSRIEAIRTRSSCPSCGPVRRARAEGAGDPALRAPGCGKTLIARPSPTHSPRRSANGPARKAAASF
jgi:proteasome-associated ATPase